MRLFTGDLVSLAVSVFGATTGCSDNVFSVYCEERGNPKLLGLALTPTNVDLIVNKENEASIKLPAKSIADRAAKLATPIRRFIAHGASSIMVTGEDGFHSNNPYSKEAHMSLVSGMV